MNNITIINETENARTLKELIENDEQLYTSMYKYVENIKSHREMLKAYNMTTEDVFTEAMILPAIQYIVERAKEKYLTYEFTRNYEKATFDENDIMACAVSLYEEYFVDEPVTN